MTSTPRLGGATLPAMRRLLVLSLLALLSAQAPRAPYVVLETGRGYDRLSEALDEIGDREATIVIRPGTHRQCAVQGAGDVTYRAAMPGTAIFDGVACEGKAALVLRGRAARIEGLVFQNIAVPDRNGAGVRLERGDLHVSQTMFLNSEQGILTADDPTRSITIDRSTFSGLGGCPDGMCSHSIYVGGYGALSVTRSRFERGTGGHYVKSRAPRIAVTDSSFDDSGGRTTNYMIDLPAGATGAIARNIFVQGRDKENYSAFVAVAAEGREHSSAGLTVTANQASFAPGVRRTSTFVADWSGEARQAAANRLGPGIAPYERRQ